MSFNIDKIIKECPNAFRKWILYTKNVKDTFEVIDYRFSVNGHFIVIIKFPDGFTLEIERHFRELYDRELYDFFDSVGVYVEVSDPTYEDYWGYNVDGFSRNGYDTRTEAEYRAFEKAFEIYEKQLKEV